MMASLLTTALAVSLVQSVQGSPSISFPFNSQLPPAARVGELYSYLLSAHTFSSTSNITYSLGDHPSWLSIEPSDGRLYGTPENSNVPAGSVVGQLVEIIATDDSGSTAMNSTLVVSRDPAPSVQVPIAQQIGAFGNYSAPSSILSYPATAFSYTFSPNTFAPDASQLSYYAVSANNSPLPSWIQFDSSTLTFSGQTPPLESLIQPPQTFGFKLVASDIVGFSAASISFSIVVGSHKLSTSQPTVTLNATQGSQLSYSGFSDSIELDGSPISPSNLSVSTERLPSWLAVDPTSLLIHGTPGPSARSANFTIQLHDQYADTLRLIVLVNVSAGLFSSAFQTIEVRPGQHLSINLATHFKDPGDVDVTITTTSRSDWLTLRGLQLSGTVPESAQASLSVPVTAQSKSSGIKETEELNIDFVSTISTSTSASSSPTTPTTTSAKPTKAKSHEQAPMHSGSGKMTTTDILLATILPLAALALAAMLLVCCMRRRRKANTYLSHKYRSQISNPVLGTLRINGSPASDDSTREKSPSTTRTERAMLKPAALGGSTDSSPASSRPATRSNASGSSGLATADLGEGFHADSRRPSTARSAATESPPRSWVTVEGTMTRDQSEAARNFRDSDTTMPESTHQILPSMEFLGGSGERSFRDGLEWTIGSLEDLPNLEPPSLVSRAGHHARKQRSADLTSLVTTSSEALPSSRRGSRRYRSAAGGIPVPRERDHEPLLEEEAAAADNEGEIQRPTPARLASQSWLRRKEGSALNPPSESSRGSKSFRASTSFGSSENWRVIGGSRRGGGEPGMACAPHRQLADERPLRPSRPSTAVSGPELMSPSKWTEVPRGLESDEGGNGSVSLVDSGPLTQGSSEGSFAVFI